MAAFVKAERKQAKLKLAITGPAGGGKTYSSLLMATGMGKKIAVIDTENGSASLYSDRFEFDTLVIEPPYTIAKYLEGIRAAESAGYDVLVIDSLSHAWAGDGGLLQKKEALDARGGNSYTNWASITKEQEQFKSALLNSDIHIIVTMRSKQDYVLETNEKGKQAPKKVGMAPIQRDGIEYEFTTVWDIAMDHNAHVSKDRTGLFDGQVAKLSKETGEAIMAWLRAGKAVESEQATPAPVDKPAPMSPEPAKPIGVMPESLPCLVCGARMIKHGTGAGYLCPNSKTRNDGHSRVTMADLPQYRLKVNTLGLNKGEANASDTEL